MIGGSAVFRTAVDLAEQARKLGGLILEADPVDLVIGDTGVSVIGSPETLVSWAELVMRADEQEAPLTAEEWSFPARKRFHTGWWQRLSKLMLRPASCNSGVWLPWTTLGM